MQGERGLVHGGVGQQRRRAVQGGGLPGLRAAVAGEAGERVGGGELVERACVERGAARKVVHIGKGALAPGGDDAPRHRFAQAHDLLQAQAHGGLGDVRGCGCGFDDRCGCGCGCGRLERAVPVALADVDGAHLDAVAARVLHELARAVNG